ICDFKTHEKIVTDESFELINQLMKFSADKVDIHPEEHMVCKKVDYNFLISICEARKKVNLGFQCDHLSIQDLINIRKKMLSREIFLTSLSVLFNIEIANGLLFSIHNIKFPPATRLIPSNFIHFFSNEQGKTVIYREKMDSFSILLFDGLFMTEFHSFRKLFPGRNRRFGEDRFGLRMKWCENEEEVKKTMENYKIVTAIKVP
ncbi:hypothetical protein PFISCL1PPCAC_19190, partial [Pristionchus fissidentatus]